MNRFAMWGVVLLLASLGVPAQQEGNKATAVESLEVPAYPSDPPWKEITNKRDERMELVEWIPNDQEEKDIKDILTKQVFYTSKDQTPSDFVTGVLKRVGQACAGARVNGPKEQMENGYPVAYAQAYCTNQKGASKDVDMFIKAIRGRDALYVVQREFRRPAKPGARAGVQTFSKDQLEEMKARLAAQSAANKYLVEKVRLCNGPCSPLAPAAALEPVAPSTTMPRSPRTSATSFVEGKSTAKEVKKALGKPKDENHNPDGRFFYAYRATDGSLVFYLFDKQGVLIRITGYTTK